MLTTTETTPRSWSRPLLVMAALALVPALLSCTRPQAAVPAPAYPALGTVVKSPDGHVRATGVVARYPVAGMGAIYSNWALYAALGSHTTSPAVIAMLFVRAGGDAVDGLSPDATMGALAAFDGKLVTVDGTLTARRLSHGPGGSSPWPELYLSSIETASPEAQAGVPWKGALVQPGRWFDDPARYALFQAYETVMTAAGAGHYGLAAVAAANGASIPQPTDPRAGRLVGAVLGGPKFGWILVYSSGLSISGPAGIERDLGAAWVYSELKQKSSSNERLVYVDGRGKPGLIGEMNGLGPGVITHYLVFYDGRQIVTIEYRGLGAGPSDTELIGIARSMSEK